MRSWYIHKKKSRVDCTVQGFKFKINYLKAQAQCGIDKGLDEERIRKSDNLMPYNFSEIKL